MTASAKRKHSFECYQLDQESRRAATPETWNKHKRCGPDTIATLFKNGQLRYWHVDAADEIREAFELVVRRVAVTTSPSSSIDGYGSFFNAFPAHGNNEEWSHHALHLKSRLEDWWRALRNRQIEHVGQLVYRVVIDGLSLREVARQLGHETGRNNAALRDSLISGLDIYADAAGIKPVIHGPETRL